MKRKEVSGKGQIKTIVEEFRDFREFVNVVKDREVVWDYSKMGTPARDRHRPSFTGCESFEEAQELLLHGYNKSVDRMVKRVNALQKSSTRKKPIRYADVCGYVPIIPNAIAGIPCSMMNQKKVEVNTRIVTILYDTNCAAHVSADEILEFGCKLINLILNLEKSGFRVRLDVMASFNDQSRNGRQYVMRVPLKNPEQPINVKRLSFAMTHAAMLRYLAFDWAERLPGSKYMSSKGIAIHYAQKKFRDNIKAHADKNTKLVYYGVDLDKVFDVKG